MGANKGAMNGYYIKLYVAGQTRRSRQAEDELRRILSEEVPGEHRLEVIDVFERPEMAEADHILATPTVIRQLPPPVRRVIGELSDHQKVLVSLDLEPNDPPEEEESRRGKES